ncbi:ATP-binding cassette domain-containing protein [Rhodobacteraceae bacterium RKSG542]|uniref:ABC transporter ATP-binding protein n=1 Tax=Pseudovibrio flavus TaxID=2529854 RepID=UPI0012BCD4A3|nr:ATP-binding cassette domain-containing protein [Pseudovibrio flavus]MTI17789.1 ATP-binding cassette domain-containing protein [Pseudovibrio flavus]
MQFCFEGTTQTGLKVAPQVLSGGEVVALTGPSGSGKSRLLRALAEIDASSMVMTLDGKANTSFPAPQWRSMVSYVGPTPYWWEDETLQSVLATPESQALGTTLGIPWNLATANISSLSTGEQQRAHLARALTQDQSRVLLLDEPTSALDEDNKRVVEELIKQRAEQGLSVLVTSHDGSQVARIAGRHLEIIGNEVVERR